MSTQFRIHEDIENVMDLNKENKLCGGKINGNDKEKRPTFAVLNNVAFDGRGAHTQKTVNAFQFFVFGFIHNLSEYTYIRTILLKYVRSLFEFRYCD